MTVMCLLVRGHTRTRNAKVFSNIAYQKRKSDKPEPSPKVTNIQRDSVNIETKNVDTKPVVNKTFVPFYEMLLRRRDEARRSILMEIEGLQDAGRVKQFCTKIGPVKHCFFYRRPGKNFVLVEFQTAVSKMKTMENSYDSKDPQSIPVFSPFLYFQSDPQSGRSQALTDLTEDIQCKEQAALKELKDLQCSSKNRLRMEMDHLYKKSKISDLSIRLRYFTCHQLDLALEGLFRDVKALPFGSTVSGFGRNSGDLDIYLHFKKNLCQVIKDDTSKLFFHSKSWVRDKSMQLKLISDLISLLLPGCTNVVSILGARVPIIKYHQIMTNVECDIQNSSAAGVDTSHILYTMNKWDLRVAPLVYSLRLWAAQNNITCVKKPSPYITNFSLMLMVIFFLQTEQILPSLHSFSRLPTTLTSSSFDPDAELFFPDLRRVEKGLLSGGNEEKIDSLLVKFFMFYSTFSFEKNKISVYHGKVMPKSSRLILEIENPTNPSLNVAKNVRPEYLQVFQIAAREAAKVLGEREFQSKSLLDVIPLTRHDMNGSVQERGNRNRNANNN
ncbi:poly(A) RNA polymerase, mitochondrial-like isoform X2 [Thrips palmi]|uniref:Poly(A) RNA polymerase, mitochondrial-like isoform X2 n=1 Tax=Thrips palmi TaxID=161013 RepID=A0A6P8YRB0_THRPL|nr:poly(A) RNA polymerase, mitochondrial-like isoform X2 [Thrips palmi]